MTCHWVIYQLTIRVLSALLKSYSLICLTFYTTGLTLCFSYCDFLVVQFRSIYLTLNVTSVRKVFFQSSTVILCYLLLRKSSGLMIQYHNSYVQLFYSRSRSIIYLE